MHGFFNFSDIYNKYNTYYRKSQVECHHSISTPGYVITQVPETLADPPSVNLVGK